MKLKDIKGDLGNQIKYDITNEINKLIFGEIEKRAPQLGFNDRFFFGNMDNFKKFLSGKPIGFKTHGYTDENAPAANFRIPTIKSVYCGDKDFTVDETSFNIETPIMHIEIDLVEEYKGWWNVVYSIVARSNIMFLISKHYDKDLVKGDTVAHTDMLGREIKIGDIVCYSTTIDNNVYVGTVEQFNDCTMVVDGSRVQYDINVLVVTDSVKLQNNKYQHKN